MIRTQTMALLVGVAALACGGDSTQPPGPPSDLVKSGGDGQSWYFHNPLPTPLSVTAVDLDGRAVPGVVVTWSLVPGSTGAVSPLQSTTNASGVATTTDSIGSSTIQMVNATFTGLAGAVSFTEHATTPPTTASVAVADFSFSPQAVVIQTGGTVTWTWSGAAPHSVTYDGGPTPRPASSDTKTGSGTYQSTITTVGRYTYHCSIHPQMTGSVTVVN